MAAPADSTSAHFAAVHAQPKGPGDARPTALDIVRFEKLEGALAGKVFLITGCSSGLGVETARALHAAGADVYCTVRDAQKSQAVQRELLASETAGKGKLELVELELGSLASVRTAAAEFLHRSGGQLNVLITNAGVGVCPESKTEDGFETQFGVNHVAHFLLFQLLRDALISSSTAEFRSRVVSVSSAAHRFATVDFDDLHFKKRKYNALLAYGQSKTANIWFALEVERRFAAAGVHATPVMPGASPETKALRHMAKEAVKAMFASSPDSGKDIKSPEQGAATTVWAAISRDLECKGGVYAEDVAFSHSRKPTELNSGYDPHAYDRDGAKKLWAVSNELVGLPADH